MAGVISSATAMQDPEVIKIEDSPEPAPPTLTQVPNAAMAQPVDPKDPEGFLRRCSGYNKKKNVRCSAIIGRNSHHSKNCHSTFLPTCYAHKDQQSYAGWCQFVQKDGEKCGRLFRWTPPYFELCAEHQGHPDTPCYFMKLPLELRLDVFRYLLPSQAIGSSTSVLHIEDDPDQQQPWFHSTTPPRAGPANPGRDSHNQATLGRAASRSIFPIPFMDLLLVNRQVHDEVKDFLYSSVPFTVDVRKDGTFMCGRRLLEPRRADGSSHYVIGDVEKIKEKFLRTFDWAAVKNYNVDILVENWKDDTNRGYHTFPWDEEVEIYDIRDYIGVVVSGILSKARNLCKLNVRLGFSKFIWTEQELHANITTLVGPFERLRNVRQPRLLGVYEGTPQTNFMISLPLPSKTAVFIPANGQSHPRPETPLCSVPQLPTKVQLFICDQPEFTQYRTSWERWISSASSTSLVVKPPIRAMFTELKEFYTRLSVMVPDVTARNGRHAFLHRARVAREQENVEAFRHLRNELIGYWEAYLEQEERKKDDMNRRLSKMLDVDVYPASWDDGHACVVGSSDTVRSTPGSSSQSPIITNAESWRSAARRSKQSQSTQSGSSRIGPVTHNAGHAQASSSRAAAGSSAQAPVVLDSAEEDSLKVESDIVLHRQAALRQQQRKMQLTQQGRMLLTQQQVVSQGSYVTLQSPAGSDGQISPNSSQTALQPLKDQQPMALNPQLHVEAAMSHRRQVEMQVHRARFVQEAKRRMALECAQGTQVHAEDPKTSIPPMSSPQSQTMPTMPVQQMQMQSQFRDITTYPNANDANESDTYSSFPPTNAPSSSTLSHQQHPETFTRASASSYPCDWGTTVPNTEPAVHVHEGQQATVERNVPLTEQDRMRMMPPDLDPRVHPRLLGCSDSIFRQFLYEHARRTAQKRPASENEQTEDAEMLNRKRQRVDSGMGWSDGGGDNTQGVDQNGDQAMVDEDQNAQYGMMYQHGGWVAATGTVWGVNEQPTGYVGKGKGKTRAEEPEVVWLD
ncbi:hypothetical protein BU23DRAFT_604676 [Bimuria novae-zelandiae CBS 107.79]|uniref:F-box domain-containing protein n=1 Tax=Bimuria novae-zelandiae CBS 107.79 TaxID=1447943 RepID=A0A6A5UUB2_9PLEO|nr:hypothetical protein BU23DRAFT_604676 [Bimuria novae-zelandiae CBS 107.79]